MDILIKLGTAYYSQGFINIKKRYEEFFGLDNSDLYVYLGTWESEPIKAKVNRRAQLIGTPRIMIGSRYTDYVQKTNKLGGTIKVQMLIDEYPNSILIV